LALAQDIYLNRTKGKDNPPAFVVALDEVAKDRDLDLNVDECCVH
jgi:hypothetical protein